MFQKKNLLLFSLLCCFAALCVSGCTAKDSASSQGEDTAAVTEHTGEETPKTKDPGFDVGIILPTMSEPRWLQDRDRFEQLLSDAALSGAVLFSDGDVQMEYENVEYCIQNGARGIILCAQNGEGARDAAERAKEAGLFVIAYDRLITGTDAVDYFVTFDSVAVGEAQARYLVEHAPAGRGIPLYLYAGSVSDHNAFLLFEGAWRILQPKIANGTFVIANAPAADACKDVPVLSQAQLADIVSDISTMWDFQTASDLAELHLARQDFKGEVLVLAPNDSTARAIADVFSADDAITDFVISGQDAEVASVQYVIDRKQSMTVFKDTRTLSAEAIDIAVALIEGQEIPASASYHNGVKDVPATQMDIVVVDYQNVREALIDTGYYEADRFTGLD